MNKQDYIFYSGAANGADKIWAEKLRQKGFTVIEYTPKDINNLSQEEFNIINKQYLDIVRILGRKQLNPLTIPGKLVRRDMLQVNNADAVYAISTLDNNGYVSGGTGYATTRATILGLKVFLYEMNFDCWMEWDYNERKFIKCNELPLLANNSAVIGSRNINSNGISAINDIIRRSF